MSGFTKSQAINQDGTVSSGTAQRPAAADPQDLLDPAAIGAANWDISMPRLDPIRVLSCEDLPMLRVVTVGVFVMGDRWSGSRPGR